MVGISVVSLATLWGASLGVASYRAARAEAAYPASGAFVEVDGHRVHYVEMGKGPDLVLIHGAFGSVRDFTFDLAGRLSAHYRVIAFDRPGMGYSDPLRGGAFARSGESPAEQAALLARAARRLGAERPVVLGHSYGGIVAMAWALEHDPAAVVMVAGVAMPWPGELGWIYQVNGTALGGGLVAPLLTALAPPGRIRDGVAATFAPDRMPDGYADHIGPYMPLRLPVFRTNVRQVNNLRPHVVEMQARYPGLTLPIEIVHGTADTTVPIEVHSRPLAARVASARLTELKGVGHMPHHTAPEAVEAAIDRAATRAGLR